MPQSDSDSTTNDEVAPRERLEVIDGLSASIRDADPTYFAGAIANEVEQILLTYLSSGPPFPADALVHPRAFEEHLLRSLGLWPEGGRLTHEISVRVRRLAREHYKNLDSVRSRRSAFGGKRDMSALLRELSLLGGPLKVGGLDLALKLSGGLSGADALLVFFTVEDQQSVGVLKLTESLAEFEREHAGLTAAETSWLSEWVVSLVGTVAPDQCEELSVRYTLLLRLAFPQALTAITNPTLHESVVAGERRAAKGVVAAVGRAYTNRYTKLFREAVPCSDANLLADILQHWPAVAREGLWEADWFWGLADLPSARIQLLQSGETNPLFQVFHQAGEAAWKYVREFQQGDLNPKNILLPAGAGGGAGETARTFCIVDFEKAAIRSIWLDLCWLGLWLVQTGLRLPATPSDWDSLPNRFVQAITTGVMPDGRTDFDLSLELAAEIGASVSTAADILPRETQAVAKPALQRQFRLTLAASALAMAFYEVRRLRVIDEHGSAEPDAIATHRQLARLYFGVATQALAEVQPRPPR